MGVSRGRSRTDGRLDFIQAGYVAQVRLMGILDHHGVPSGHGCLCSMVLRPVERLVFSPKER